MNFPFSPNPWFWIRSTRPRPFPPDTFPTIFKKSESEFPPISISTETAHLNVNFSRFFGQSNYYVMCQSHFWMCLLCALQPRSSHNNIKHNQTWHSSSPQHSLDTHKVCWNFNHRGRYNIQTANQNSAVNICHVNVWHSFRLRTETNEPPEGATISAYIFWVISSNQNFVGSCKTACSYDKLNKSYITTTVISHTQEKKQSYTLNWKNRQVYCQLLPISWPVHKLQRRIWCLYYYFISLGPRIKYRKKE